jgi:hypothetical protein
MATAQGAGRSGDRADLRVRRRHESSAAFPHAGGSLERRVALGFQVAMMMAVFGYLIEMSQLNEWLVNLYHDLTLPAMPPDYPRESAFAATWRTVEPPLAVATPTAWQANVLPYFQQLVMDAYDRMLGALPRGGGGGAGDAVTTALWANGDEVKMKSLWAAQRDGDRAAAAADLQV